MGPLHGGDPGAERAAAEAGGGDADYARRAVDGTTVEVDGCGRSVRIRTGYDGVFRQGVFAGWRNVPRVHYEIRAPRQLDVDLDIDRGDLVIELAETQPLTIAADMSRRGDFSSDLPVTMQRTGRNFLGTGNGGGPELRIEADRSDIRLRAIN